MQFVHVCVTVGYPVDSHAGDEHVQYDQYREQLCVQQVWRRETWLQVFSANISL